MKNIETTRATTSITDPASANEALYPLFSITLPSTTLQIIPPIPLPINAIPVAKPVLYGNQLEIRTLKDVKDIKGSNSPMSKAKIYINPIGILKERE